MSALEQKEEKRFFVDADLWFTKNPKLAFPWFMINGIVHNNGTLYYPDGKIEHFDGRVEYPDGKIVHPDGSVTFRNKESKE